MCFSLKIGNILAYLYAQVEETTSAQMRKWEIYKSVYENNNAGG